MKATIKKVLIGLLMLAVLFLSTRDVYSTPDQAKITALAMAFILEGQYGCQLRDEYHHGFLMKGESYIISTYLAEGLTYYFAAGGCDAAYDIDVAVYDENWNLIVKDNSEDASAWVSLIVYRTSEFHIKITMYNCGSSGADWALVCGFI